MPGPNKRPRGWNIGSGPDNYMRNRTGSSHPNYIHGWTTHPLYPRWNQARQRCFLKSHKQFADYGGRGITMCKRWKKNFHKFCKDMGPCPRGLTLDRKNNDGHYSCGKCKQCKRNDWSMNCRWATQNQQMNNQRPKHRTAKGIKSHSDAMKRWWTPARKKQRSKEVRKYHKQHRI